MKTTGLLVSVFAGWMCLLVTETPAQIPVIGNYNVYYGSLHNHTAVSDGKGTPDQAYKYARDVAGLDFFGLSDHSNLMSSTEWTTIKNAANYYNKDGDFAAFYGFEWTTYLSYGHVSIVGTEDYCSTGTATSTFTKLLGWLNARNGIAFFNHPGWDWSAFNEFNHFTDTPSDKFVGMELWNDNDGFSKYYDNDGYYSNDGGKGYFDEALIRKWKIGAAGADDNHDADWGTATPYRVGVLAGNLTRTEIMEAFKARRFFSTIDKDITMSFKINGAEMGSTIAGGNLNFQIQAKDGTNEMFTQVVLMKNGAVLKTWTYSSVEPIISQYFSCANGDYFYVRVKQYDGGEAISSPIFISGTANQPPTVSLTSPANGAYPSGQSFTISASAADADGTVASVEFYINGSLLFADNTAPYEYPWSPANGSYSLTAKAYDNLGASSVSAPVTITITAPVSGVRDVRISGANDDAEQYQKGAVLLNDLDIDLVYDSKTSGNQTVGLYFRNLNIPAGVTITNAYIRFTALLKTINTCSLQIKGQLSANPAEFLSTSKNLSLRSKTVATISWDPGSWNNIDEYGSAQQTPELKSIVQEIVNLSSATTNNLVILITGTGTRTAYSFDKDAAKAATLHLEFSGAQAQSQEILKSTGVAVKNPSLLTEQPVQEGNVQLYPNPVTDKLNIRVTGDACLEQIEIYSVSSALVVQKKIEGRLQETSLDCTEFIPGTYVVVVKTTQGNYPLKIVKK